MRYIKNDSLYCKFSEKDELNIAVTDNDVITVTDGTDMLLELLSIFSEPHSYEEAFELLNMKGSVAK